MLKRTFVFLLVLITLISATFSSLNIIYADSVPAIDSGCAILMDMKTGQILFNKGMHEKSFPASTTKIMTAVLAIEKGGYDTIVTVNEETLHDIEIDSSKIYLSVGETISVEQLLYGLMLNSGNDAANALAQYVSGSIPAFAELMTEKARSVGALNTNFKNPHGLHDENHYTTAYDLAMITRYAVKLPFFKEIISTVRYQIPPTNKYNETRFLKNTHKLLSEKKYDPAIGGKTGWTTPAGNTLVTVAEQNGRQLISVVLRGNNSNAVYTDTRNLLEYGFNSFKEITISKSDLAPSKVNVVNESDIIGDVEVFAASDYTLLIPKDVDEADIIFDFEIPESIDKDDAIEAKVKFMLPESKLNSKMESCLGEMTLKAGELNLIPNQNNANDVPGNNNTNNNNSNNGKNDSNKNDYSPASFFSNLKLSLFQIICFSVGGLIIFLLLVALCIRRYNMMRRRRRRRIRG